MKKFPLVDIEEAARTKDRILLAAVKLFAENGYAAVSVRAIADALNMTSASLYNHYKSKEALFDAIIDTVKTVYLDFYNRVDQTIEKASCFEDVINALFGELIDVYHLFIYYGVTLLVAEQSRNDKARRAFQDVYMKEGIDYSTRIFNECIERKWVKTFNTRSLATFFMNNILAGSLMRAQEGMNHATAYGSKQMFVDLKQHMLDSVEVIERY